MNNPNKRSDSSAQAKRNAVFSELNYKTNKSTTFDGAFIIIVHLILTSYLLQQLSDQTQQQRACSQFPQEEGQSERCTL